MEMILNGLISVLTHLLGGLFLLVYVPISMVWKLASYIFVRPFKEENMKGKVVLITGASSGIGEQLAYEYARKGASLVLVARREHALKAVAKAARGLGSPDVLVIPADVSVAEDSRRIIDDTITYFGKINHLVANAGIWSCSALEEITNISAFTQLMDVNFWGAVYPTYYAIPHLKEVGGRIVVNASIAGKVPAARMSFYSASKAALIRFYQTLRSELGTKVGITIVTLGYVASELTGGKVLRKEGEMGVDEDVRDVQVGPFLVGHADSCAAAIVRAALAGDSYLTWPSWYRPFSLMMFAAPEVLDCFSRVFYMAGSGSGSGSGPAVEPLSKRILKATGAKKFLYPSSIRSQEPPK